MMINVYIKGVGAQIQIVQSLGLTNSWFSRPDHQVFSSKTKTENPKRITNWYHVFLSQRQQLCLLRFFVSRNPPAPSNLQFGSAELDTSFKWIVLLVCDPGLKWHNSKAEDLCSVYLKTYKA